MCFKINHRLSLLGFLMMFTHQAFSNVSFSIVEMNKACEGSEVLIKNQSSPIGVRIVLREQLSQEYVFLVNPGRLTIQLTAAKDDTNYGTSEVHHVMFLFEDWKTTLRGATLSPESTYASETWFNSFEGSLDKKVGTIYRLEFMKRWFRSTQVKMVRVGEIQVCTVKLKFETQSSTAFVDLKATRLHKDWSVDEVRYRSTEPVLASRKQSKSLDYDGMVFSKPKLKLPPDFTQERYPHFKHIKLERSFSEYGPGVEWKFDLGRGLAKLTGDALQGISKFRLDNMEISSFTCHGIMFNAGNEPGCDYATARFCRSYIEIHDLYDCMPSTDLD